MLQPRPSAPQPKLWGELVPALARRLLTAREFALLLEDTYDYELVKGRVIQMPPPQDEHSNVQANLIALLKQWQKQGKRKGRVRGELGILLDRKGQAPTIVGPDVSYIAPGRRGEREDAYERIAPDFVTEIVSPSQYRPEMLTKVNLYLAAGVRLLWLVWPNPQIVEVWEADDTTAARAQHGDLPRSRIFTSDDTLAGFAALPEFTCPVSAIFADDADENEPADEATDPLPADE